LLIWPESSAPFLYGRDPVFRGAIESMAKQAHAYVISGTVTFAGRGNNQPQNAAVLLAPDGQLLLHYVKIHLVPFGEYVPWWAFPGKVGKITAEVGDFVPGKSVKVARTSEGVIGIFICYEAIFPQLVRKFAADGAGVLVNISDDGWYGDSSAPFSILRWPASGRLRTVGLFCAAPTMGSRQSLTLTAGCGKKSRETSLEF